MDTLVQLLEMVLHIDKHLGVFIDQYGNWVYLFLFMIVFVETGLVLFPFLPGDSLLFIGGAFAATGAMDPWLLGVLLFVAAVTGNTLNYWIGSKIGPRVYEKNWRFLDRDALRKTHDFYEHHGGKTIVMARFVPVVRTFAPFVAGVAEMPLGRFQLFNIGGAVLWVAGLVAAGYFFGNIPLVREHLNTIVLIGLAAAIVPVALAGMVKLLRGARRA